MVAIISDFRDYMTMPKRVNVERRKLILDDFFKVEEVYLSYERFDGSMSPLVRRLNFERGDSVAD